MAIKFLDLTGLTKFWNKCKNAFVAKDSSGNVKVTGALEVTGTSKLIGDLDLQGQILGHSYGATFGNDVEITKGALLQLWDEEDNKYAALQCGTDGEIHLVKEGIAGSPLATHSFVTTAVTSAVANAGHLKREKVDVLPGVVTAKENVIYMVPNGTAGGNKFDEYMLLDGSFEKTGSSDVDLSGYSTTTEMNSAISTAISAAHTAITATEIDSLS